MYHSILKQLLTLGILLMCLNCMAQKYGHLNSGNLMEAFPEVVSSDKELEKYQKDLLDAFTVKMEAFENAYNDLNAKVQDGHMSPKETQEGEAKLKTMQEEIVALERENDQKIRQKRVELLQPLLDKVNDAIQVVGKENGYTMIFDTAVFNAILFVDDSVDVTALVKAKLGI